MPGSSTQKVLVRAASSGQFHFASRFSSRFGCSVRVVASIRIRQRKDGTAYTSVLYVHQGKQTSSSFNDHAEALRSQDVVNRLGPAEALRIWEVAVPSEGHTVASFIAEHLDSLSGTEKKTLVDARINGFAVTGP